MNAKRPAISVVIPVYKVERFLNRCIDSVCNQTLKDLEIILVDDGSPDKCPAICDRYASVDKRIHVIHKANGGLASARNAGMEAASGRYLFFLDSDDWIDPDGLEILHDLAERYQVDFVRYRAIRSGWPNMETDTPCMVEPVRELEGGLYTREDIREKVFPRLITTESLTLGSVVGAWGSLYDLDFLNRNHIRFNNEVRFSEDILFSAMVVYSADSFYYRETAGVYHYFYNSESISKSFRADRWGSCKGIISECERIYLNDPEYDFSSQVKGLKWFCIFLALNERKYIASYIGKFRYCRSILHDDLLKQLSFKPFEYSISLKQMVLMILVKLKASAIIALI